MSGGPAGSDDGGVRDADEAVCLPGFGGLLDGYGEDELRRHEDAVYALTPELDLAYLNPAWFRFADANDGASIRARWGLGASVLDAIGGPARALFAQAFARCLERGSAWSHDYECSSYERFRRFHMDVFPLEAARGLLVVHTLVAEGPHGAERVERPPVAARYTDAAGLVLQCSFCRRVQRADGSGAWEWVPAWVHDPPAHVTGGLCRPCLRVHFSD